MAEQVIPVWTYYFDPPFITGEGQGLSVEFIGLLNEHFRGQYRFELEELPRSRINRNLDEQLAGIVLFVNWAWMGDPDKTKYLWSLPILSDRNEVVSRVNGKPPTRIDFAGAESLKGMVFGGLTGRRYKGLEESFKNNSITRNNVRQEEQNLELLLLDRIDVTSGSSSVIRYMVKVKGLEQDIFFSPTPLFSYTRHLLITPPLKPLEPLLNRFIEDLQHSPVWASIRTRYAVE